MNHHAARLSVDKALVGNVEIFDQITEGRALGPSYGTGQICLSAPTPVIALSQLLLRSRSILPQKLDAPSFRRGAIVEILLGAAFPIPYGRNTFLRSLWAEEAMNRAENMLELILLLEKHSWTKPDSPLTLRLEGALAKQIAAIFRSLNVRVGEPSQLCTDSLEGIVTGLAELFNPGSDELVVVTELAMLALPTSKRKALVLAAAELVSQFLLNKFRNRHSAQIRVTLERRAGRKALFLMEDPGRSIEAKLPTVSVSIVSRLARLLEAEVLYRRSRLGGTTTEFLFPA
jgi:hypothetical protein